MTKLAKIEKFLTENRIAIVGVSRDPRDFSRSVFREFLARHYDVVPVNPLVSLIEDKHCFGSIKDVSPPVDSVLVMTPPPVTEDIVRECADAGVKNIWFHRSVGGGTISPNAISYCKEHHIDVIEGHCPLMFLQPVGAIHRIHRFFSKLAGNYPK